MLSHHSFRDLLEQAQALLVQTLGERTAEARAVSEIGTETTLTLPTGSSVGEIPATFSVFEGFADILNRLEEANGCRRASQAPIAMDLVRDDLGVPFPVPRFDCPWCRLPTHPRYQSNLDTEVCEKCGKILYPFR